MKASFNQKELVSAVTTVQRAVSAKSSNPALEGILLKVHGSEATLCGYDLDIGITSVIPATVIEEGDIVLGAHLFAEMTKRMPDSTVTIETDEKLITTITSYPAEFQLVGMTPEEYPELPSFDTLRTFEIEVGTLKGMIRDTFYAISDNPAKPALMGSYFDADNGFLNIVSIDGFRMSVRREKIDSEEKFDFILPKKTLAELLKTAAGDEESFTVALGKKHVVFKVSSYSVVSRLIEGKYVDYRATIPNGSSTSLTIESGRMINSLERMSLMTSDKMQQPVHLVVADDGMKLFCTTSLGKANDFIETSFEGDELEIGFNNRYMLDAVKNIESDMLCFEFNGANRPLKILPTEGDSFIVLVVPMRI